MKMGLVLYRLFIKGALLGLLLAFWSFIYAADTLEIDGSLGKLHLTEFVTVFDTSESLSPEMVLSLSKNTDIFKEVESTTFGFSTNYYWIKINLRNISSEVMKTVIVVNNPHIDYLASWEVMGNEVMRPVYMGGDGMPFEERTFLNRNLIIPLDLLPQIPKTVFLLVDKRNASVSVPLSLKKRSVFEKQEKENHLFYGVYFGILLVIIVFALFVFTILRQEIFFWYAFYIFFLGVYLMAHIGLLFQIGYPNLNEFNDYSRPFFITFSTSALIHFIRLLLNVKQLLPRLNPIFNHVIIILNAATFWWVLTPWWHDFQTIIYLNIQNFTLLFALVLVLVASVLTFNQQRIIVGFFWVAFMAVLFAGLSIILIESGLINETLININPLFIGSLIEVVVFAMGLAYWSKVNENDRLELISLVQESKKQMVDSYINGIESEKQKISSDLHDDIGSRLSHLKRMTESDYKDHPEIIHRFERITQKVRSLSHELAPPSFAKNEFLISIRHLVSSHDALGVQTTLQIFDIPDSIDGDVTKQLYRIVQSALGHIEQLSKATTVDIQFFYHNSELVLAIEDNGIGFVSSKENSSMAFKEIESRVKTLSGTVDISSVKNRGTSVMITVPI